MRLVSLLLLVFMLSAAKAQAGISPLFHFLELEQGRAQTTFTIINASGTAVRYRIIASAFDIIDGELTFFEPGDERITADLSPYLRMAPQEVDVPALSQQRVRVIVAIPPSDFEKELRAALRVMPLVERDEPTDTPEAGSVKIVVSYNFFAPIFLQTSDKNISVAVEGVEFVSGDATQGGENVEDTIALKLSNLGNVSLAVGMRWQVLGDGVEAVRAANPKSFLLLTEGEQTVTLPVTDLGAGTYTISGEIRDLGNADSLAYEIAPSIHVFSETFTVP